MKANEGELEDLFPSNNVEELSLSYSKLSRFDKDGCRALREQTFFGNDGTKMGGLIDDMLYDKEKVKESYFIFNGSQPTATLGSLTNIILENYNELPSEEEVLKVVKRNNYWSRTIDKVSKFNLPEFWNYLRAKYKERNGNKILITTNEWILAEEVANTLITHDNSKHFFSGEYEVLTQYKFKYKYKNFMFRGIMDMIVIDRNKKTVRFVDLKTGKYPLLEFPEGFVTFRYYLQEAVYMKAWDVIKEELGLEEYELLPFQFLYISRKEKIPFVFTVTEKWHKAALEGFNIGRYRYKSLDELIELVRWHIINNEYVYPKPVVEANGLMDLDDSFITLD